MNLKNKARDCKYETFVTEDFSNINHEKNLKDKNSNYLSKESKTTKARISDF